MFVFFTKQVNNRLEVRFPQGISKPQPTSPDDAKKQYIYQKYVEHAFAESQPVLLNDLKQTILEMVRELEAKGAGRRRQKLPS